MRGPDGAITDEPILLLDDLVEIARESHPDAVVQFDLKEHLADLDETTISSFARLVAPNANRFLLSGDDWNGVRAIGERVDGLKLGFDPSDLPEARALESAKDFSDFTRFTLAAAPNATIIYLDYRLVLASLFSGYDMIAGLHSGGRTVDAWTFDVTSQRFLGQPGPADWQRRRSDLDERFHRFAGGGGEAERNECRDARVTERLIHLVFKTHLDIGFTDHAEKVRRQYHERFIPQAIDTGEHFYREDPRHPKFIWTTGAWLIWDHLEHAGKAAAARLEQAIERGLIRWHALPFTTHSELMSPDLFRAGLSYGQELDRRFGRTTIAAKMTDVPGHTIGIVPLLAEAGVRFLHLGVNTASPVPDVPDVFRWRAPGGEEVVVMYQNSYGATHFPEGFDDGLSFAHTIDNVGPQSVSQTADAYRHLQAEYPDARIEAATLDDYGALLWAERERFPVVDVEIGDSWIHGIGTDPTKTARFLALQRLYDRFAARGR